MLSEAIRNRIPDLPEDESGPAPRPPSALRPSFQAAREVTARHAKTFYFASRFLPESRKYAAYAVYAYCRHIDDLVDEAARHEDIPDRNELRHINRLFLNGEHNSPYTAAFAWTCKAYRIPLLLLDELAEGCCRDREPIRIQTFAELEEYSYLVASVVGLMMCRVFGVRSTAAYPRAAEMGIAMQLTNILRDIREDQEKGRIYLPADECRDAGIEITDLTRKPPTPRTDAFLRQQIQRTRDWYASARGGLPLIQDKAARRTASVMAGVYAGILDEIEKSGYDIRTRHHVSLPRKCRLAWRHARLQPSPKEKL